MKKHFLVVLMAVSLLASGCSSSPPSTSDNSAELKKLQTQIEELKTENKELKEQLSTIAETTTEEETTEEETQASQQGTNISVGEVITTENIEITIKKVELVYDVLPDDTSGFYTHYEADPGNVYLHVDTDIKNIGKQNLRCDNLLTVVADYNNGYTYNGFAVPEDSSTGFTYANITSITPLETLGIRFLIKCPQEVEETENPLFLTIEPAGTKDTYTITVR
jgi:outer membrane murein-binding lipoprotein Lpp